MEDHKSTIPKNNLMLNVIGHPVESIVPIDENGLFYMSVEREQFKSQ